MQGGRYSHCRLGFIEHLPAVFGSRSDCWPDVLSGNVCIGVHMGQITRTNFGMTKITNLTNAQVLGLVSGPPVTILPGVAGRIWYPTFVVIALTPYVADYTNIDPTATFALGYG